MVGTKCLMLVLYPCQRCISSRIKTIREREDSRLGWVLFLCISGCTVVSVHWLMFDVATIDSGEKSLVCKCPQELTRP